MKRAISCWAFTPKQPLKEIFDVSVHAGFEGIELAYALDGPINPSSTRTDIRGILSLAKNSGIAISSLATGIFWSVNTISDCAEEREKAKRHVRKMLEIADMLGVSAILTVPGWAGPFEAGDPAVADYDKAFARAVSDFQELGASAEKYGVNIGIENVWNKFLSSAYEMRAFIDLVGCKYVGCYFDVGNILRTGYPEQWIHMLGNRIKGIHFKDFKLSVGNLQGFVGLLEGDVNYPRVMSALKAINYDGYCVAEVFARPGYPNSVPIKAGIDMEYIFNLFHSES